ncbi:O-antigen translocase [Enterobacter sp. ENT03]|uniref:O-antigen translocase n=1 Tax=Enterobacter sp. ENT03 TaxID=2854780 RepID=UPI0035292A5E
MKTSILSFIATAVKMLAGLVINKAIAILIGPGGLAMIGQFQNFYMVTSTIAQGGINSGITKYTAEYFDNDGKRTELWSTSLRITLLFSCIVSLFLIVGSTIWSKFIFGNANYNYVFRVLGCTVILFSLNQLLLSVINGLKEIRKFITINITQSIYSLLFTTLLIYFFGLNGALFALVTNQSVIFLIVLWYLRKHPLITFARFRKKWENEQAKKLLQFSLMSLISAFCLPVSQIVIRDYVAKVYSWDYAGYWQAMTYISTTYLLVITTALSIYYLPRLSEINNKKELRSELLNGYKIIIPIVSLMAFVIYLLREHIMLILFSANFSPMLSLFKWQMIGDVIKIISWLIAYIMLAKAMTKSFIITEVLFAVSFCILSISAVSFFGFKGLSYAFAINYFIYFWVVLLVVWKKVI